MTQKTITATQLDMASIAAYFAANPTAGVVSSISISSSDLTIGGSPVTSSGVISLSLPNVNGNIGTFNNVTVNSKGLVTAASNVAYLTSISSSNVISALGYTPVNPAANTSMTGTLTFDGAHTITGLPSPTSSTDAATKSYVDAALSGLAWKNPAQAATTANLSATYSGTPNFTLTNAGAQAAFVTDGYTANVNDRILVKNQSTQSQNGVYVVTNIGSVSTNWVLTRATDFQTAAEANGAALLVQNGTTYANSQWTQVDKVITFDTDPIAFTQFGGTTTGVSSVTAGSGISVNQTTGAVTVTNTGVLSVAGTAGNITASTVSGAATLNLATAGTAGTYVQVTTDAYGRVISGSATTSIANLTGTLSASQFPALTGDVTTTAGSLATTLATVNSNVGSFGSGTQVGTFTVNAKGLITAASNVAINITTSQVSGLAASATTDTTNAANISSGTLAVARLPALSATGDATGTGTAGTGSIPLTLATVNTNIGTFNNVTVNAKGLVTAASNVAYLTANQNITLTGDATGSGTTSIPVTLASTGVTAGTYGDKSHVAVIAVDAKGRITSVSTATITAQAAAGGVTGNLQYNDAGGLVGTSTINYTSASPNQLTLGDGSAAFSILGFTGGATSSDLIIKAGNLSSGAGSSATVAGGNASGTNGNGGGVTITGGNAGSTTGAAGNVIIETGTAATGQAGGSIIFSTAPSGGTLVTRFAIDSTGAWNLAGSPGTTNQVLVSKGTGTPPIWASTSSLPVVTSVGLSDASTSPLYSVSNSPVTSSGTIDITLNNQNANTVLAGPSSGPAAQPTFRQIVAADVSTTSTFAGQVLTSQGSGSPPTWQIPVNTYYTTFCGGV